MIVLSCHVEKWKKLYNKKTQWMCYAQERKDDPLDADVPSEKKRREYFLTHSLRSEETKLTAIHEDVGLIPGLTLG